MQLAASMVVSIGDGNSHDKVWHGPRSTAWLVDMWQRHRRLHKIQCYGPFCQLHEICSKSTSWAASSCVVDAVGGHTHAKTVGDEIMFGIVS